MVNTYYACLLALKLKSRSLECIHRLGKMLHKESCRLFSVSYKVLHRYQACKLEVISNLGRMDVKILLRFILKHLFLSDICQRLNYLLML